MLLLQYHLLTWAWSWFYLGLVLALALPWLGLGFAFALLCFGLGLCLALAWPCFANLDTTNCTISHDCLTTAMLSNALTVNFIPRICMQQNSGGQWRTFYHFASYKEAHTTALQDIKRGNSLRKVDSDATHDLPWLCLCLDHAHSSNIWI